MSISSRYGWRLLARVAGKGTVAAAFLIKLSLSYGFGACLPELPVREQLPLPF